MRLILKNKAVQRAPNDGRSNTQYSERPLSTYVHLIYASNTMLQYFAVVSLFAFAVSAHIVS